MGPALRVQRTAAFSFSPIPDISAPPPLTRIVDRPQAHVMKKALFFTAVGALVILSFISHLALPLAVAIIATLVWAFRSDKNMWRTKPAGELVAMVESDEWRYLQTAMEELRRRGEDISRFIPRLVSGLFSDSVLARTAADAALRELFPEFKEQLKRYLPTQDVAVARQKLAPLLARYER